MAVGSTPRDSGNIPLSCGGSPGDATPQQIQLGNEYTDANGNITAPIRAEITPGSKDTYTYAVFATAPYATPTDWIVIRGSATKLVKIVRIEFSGAATSATSGIPLVVKKHTVANTAGTSTNPTPMKHDSNDPAATALVLLYTVAPTIDGTATVWKSARITLTLVAAAAGTVAIDKYVWDAGASPFEPLTLRGVAQECAFFMNSVAIPGGGVYDLAVTWTEE